MLMVSFVCEIFVLQLELISSSSFFNLDYPFFQRVFLKLLLLCFYVLSLPFYIARSIFFTEFDFVHI